MDETRKQIDDIDSQIIELLGKRMNLVKEIGQIKKESGSDITDEGREEEIRERLKELAVENGLSDEFVNHLYTHIFVESRRIQS
jgi:chorismate mutase